MTRRNGLCGSLLAVLVAVTFVLAGCGLRRADRAPAGEPRLLTVVNGDTVTTHNLDSLFQDPRFRTGAGRAGMGLARHAGHAVALGQIREAEVLHRHRRHDLVVFLLEGRGRLETTGGTVPLRADDGLVVPRGIPHRFVPTGDRPARALILRTPPPEGRDFHPAEPGRDGG